VTEPVGGRYPYAFDRSALAGEIKAQHNELEGGEDSGVTVRVAGRIRTIRTHGKVAFADLEDPSGRIQLFAQQGVLGDEGMEAFAALSVGDIVGAEGEVVRTKRGELSVRIAATVVLAPCERPMPDSWHGVTDVETRYRQRYLDLIVNPEARRALEARSKANDIARKYLEGKGFVEVETPILQPIASGAVARPFVTHHNTFDIDLYLRVAPELYLKRLLIGGVDRVYELDKSFRNEGVSSRHNPEYTMLEAYEAYVDYHDTMTLVENLVRAIAESVVGSLQVERDDVVIDLSPAFKRVTMFDAISNAGGPTLESEWRAGDEEAINAAAEQAGVKLDPRWPAGKVLVELFEHVAESTLVQPTFVAGYPKDVSPLAKDHREIPGFTEHADMYMSGIELAAIYSELNDPAEQRRRFEQQAQARAAGDQEAAALDEQFLEALAYGMPPAGGFGLGMDRLLTVLLGLPSLREVILFPTQRPESD
jgi:lysyl-tRNA synthetase, class II